MPPVHPDQTRQKKEFEICRTFGVSVEMPRPHVMGWDRPFACTPAVDPDFKFCPQTLIPLLCVLETRFSPALVTGPTGAGKSALVLQMAARLNLPFFRMSLDQDTTRAELLGAFVLENGATRFQKGGIPTAMEKGALLLLDEWDCVGPDGALILQTVLEGGPIYLPETGRTIFPHPDFRIMATSNTRGFGDPDGIHTTGRIQGFALLDRFSPVVKMDYPPPEQERGIISAKTGLADLPGENLVSRLVAFANEMRKAFLNGEMAVPVSTRTLIEMVRLLLCFGDLGLACDLAFANKLEPEDRAVCREFFQRMFG